MIGFWAIGACFWQLAVAWVFPVVILPHLTNNPWVGIASALAQARLAPLVGVLLSLAGAGVACILVSLFMGGGRRMVRPEVASPSTDVPLAPVATGPRAGWATWPTNRAGRRETFGAAHRRTSSGQDPDHKGDWLL